MSVPKRKPEGRFAFSMRNDMDSCALFELGLERLPYCMVQVSERGWVLLNRDYLVLPEGRWRLEDALSPVIVHEFEQDPHTFEGVWTKVTDRHLYLSDTQFEDAAGFHDRLQRLWAYQLGCVGRT
jgi:hypothetical protein